MQFQGRQLRQNGLLLSEYGSYLSEENLLLCESKFFSYRVDPFSEGDWHAVMQTGSLESCLLGENREHPTIVYNPHKCLSPTLEVTDSRTFQHDYRHKHVYSNIAHFAISKLVPTSTMRTLNSEWLAFHNNNIIKLNVAGMNRLIKL